MRSSTDRDLEGFLAAHTPIRTHTAFADGACVGEWRITAFLGKGGSGEVYRAEHLRDHTPVALKIRVPNPDRSASQEDASRQRFEREERILSENAYPFFPHFFGGGTEHGFLYFAIELLDPITLPSAERDVEKFLLQIAAAVRVLHRHGLVHRDLKPQNIMRRKNGELVLIDLGLVKETPIAGTTSTSSVTLVDGKAVGVGTPHYAAPEQLSGGAISPATDIHALGIMANDCFDGRPPKAWEPIISRSTSSIPELRYEDIDAFVRGIRRRHLRRNLFAAAAAVLLTGGALLLPFAGHYSAPGYPIPAVDAATAVGSMSELRERIAAAKSGEVIGLKPGRYEGSLSVTGKVVKLIALDADPNRTILVGEPQKSVIHFARGCGGSMVCGLTITGGTGMRSRSGNGCNCYGGGICADSSVTVVNSILRGNGKGETRESATTFGGGLWARYESVVRMINCLVADNYAWACGGAVGAENAEVVIDRCTIADNHSTLFFGDQGGVGLAFDGRAFVNNSILWGNSGEQLDAFSGPHARGTFAYLENCTVENGVHAGNIQTFDSRRCQALDPRFADHETYLPQEPKAVSQGFRIDKSLIQ